MRRTRTTRLLIRLLTVLGATVVTAAVSQLGREAVAERRGTLAPTYAATRVTLPPATGRLARRMEEPVDAVPKGLRAVLRRLWAGPTTIVGLFLAALSAGQWRWSAEHGAIIVSGARSPLLAMGGFQANALGHVIVARPHEVSQRLLVHEAAHVRQAELLGPATLPLYVWWLARHGYRNHPMERGARASTRAWMADQNPSAPGT